MTRTTVYRSRGIAIVMVLAAITLISAIVIEINYRSQVSAMVVANRRDGEKAYELARAAVRWSIFRLQLDNALDQIPVIQGTNYGGRKDDLSEVQWAVPLPYPLPVGALGAKTEGGDVAAAPPAESDIGGSFVSALTDESSKINLNDVGSNGIPGSTRNWSAAAIILENLLLTPRFQTHFKGKDHREILWAIDDWTDGDSEVNHLGGGIEDAEYQTEDRDLHVKNAPFYSVEEIRLLKPMTEELFREIRPFVTVYPFDSRIPRMSTQPITPMGRINVNTAPLEILAALINRATQPEAKDRLTCAQNVVKIRKGIVFRAVTGQDPSFDGALRQACGLASTPGPQGGILVFGAQQVLQVRSDVFSVEGTGSVEQTEKTIHAVISRQNPTQPRILYWKVI